MILLKAGLAEAMDEAIMNGQWDTSSDVTLIVFLIVCALYAIIAIGIRIAFVYYCGKLLLNYLNNRRKKKQDEG